MQDNLLIGCLMMAACIFIQCFVVGILLHFYLQWRHTRSLQANIIQTAIILTVVLLIMLAANLIQVSLWASLFVIFNEFETFTEAFYHSLVNFTALGYGDIVMSEKRRLLGALEAANGVLMFGLTTGVLLAIMNELLEKTWRAKKATKHKKNDADSI